MDKSLAAGLLVFIVAYFVLGCIATAGLQVVGWNNGGIDNFAIYVLMVPLAIIAGLFAGRLNAVGVAVASLLLALGIQCVIVGILDALARPYGDGMSLAQLYREPFASVSLFGLIATVVAPLIWLMVIRRFREPLLPVG